MVQLKFSKEVKLLFFSKWGILELFLVKNSGLWLWEIAGTGYNKEG